MIKVAVIGAGASGMMAAITAADNGAQVFLFEKNDRVGKKILATGNGKCNLSNLNGGLEHYYCEDREKLGKLFQIFSVMDTVAFFENTGLMIKEKNGYLYPYCEQASAVLDILRRELARKGVQVITDAEIVNTEYQGNGFAIETADGRTMEADKMIIACGSYAALPGKEKLYGYQAAEKYGHKIKNIVPGLVSLRSDASFCKALAGVRSQAKISLRIDGQEAASETGEVQFTDYGVSGIPVFQFSRQAAYACSAGQKTEVVLDFFPEQELKVFYYNCRLRFEALGDLTIEEFFTGMLHKKINMVLIKENGQKPGDRIQKLGFERLWEILRQCKEFVMHITEASGYDKAQVCAGGVLLEELSTQLESVKVKGLYFAGEVVDVDGMCGGYNLQWAWTSGYIAGRNAAGNSTEELLSTPMEEKNA